MTLEQKIEAILLFKNEPVSYSELAKILEIGVGDIKNCIRNLHNRYKDRGIVIIDDGDKIALGTHKDVSPLIEKIQKEELSRDLGKAGLETLSIVLYKGPVSRREIDYIRGVNSSFILRNLLIRGLIERSEALSGERSYSYKPTLELLRYLGVSRIEDLPEYGTALTKIETFIQASQSDANE